MIEADPEPPEFAEAIASVTREMSSQGIDQELWLDLFHRLVQCDRPVTTLERLKEAVKKARRSLSGAPAPAQSDEPCRLLLRELYRVVKDVRGIDPGDDMQTREYVQARYAIMLVLKETGYNPAVIARVTGKHRATVLHGIEDQISKMQIYPSSKRLYTRLVEAAARWEENKKQPTESSDE